jgi:hypothetical protein
MSFTELFKHGLGKFNPKIENESKIKEILEEYDGREITVKVTDDTTYVFHLSPQGVTLDISPRNLPDDIYLETSKEILQKMIDRKRVDVSDVLKGRIKWKNITRKEISLIKQIMAS